VAEGRNEEGLNKHGRRPLEMGYFSR